jgi:hypothetical protein
MLRIGNRFGFMLRNRDSQTFLKGKVSHECQEDSESKVGLAFDDIFYKDLGLGKQFLRLCVKVVRLEVNSTLEMGS